MIETLYQCEKCKRVFVSNKINPVCPNDDTRQLPPFKNGGLSGNRQRKS